MNSDNELPNYIYIGGFIGMIILAISVLLFIAYIILYNESHDHNVALGRKNFETIESVLYYGYIASGFLGFLLALLIPFGHYIKSDNDPSSIASKNSHEFEIVDHEEGVVKSLKPYKVSEYKNVTNLGRGNLLSSGNDKYSQKGNDILL